MYSKVLKTDGKSQMQKKYFDGSSTQREKLGKQITVFTAVCSILKLFCILEMQGNMYVEYNVFSTPELAIPPVGTY